MKKYTNIQMCITVDNFYFCGKEHTFVDKIKTESLYFYTILVYFQERYPLFSCFLAVIHNDTDKNFYQQCGLWRSYPQ